MSDQSNPPAPQSAEEAAKAREQVRDHAHDRKMKAAEKYVETAHAERLEALRGVKEYGLQSVRALVILNGGGTLALLTFTGSLFARTQTVEIGVSFANAIASAFYCYGAGLVAAALVSGIGYLNFSAVAETYSRPGDLYHFVRGENSEPRPKWLGRFVDRSRWAAVICAVLGLAAFIYGSVIAVRGLGKLAG